MVPPSNYPMAGTLSSARWSARVSSLPHSHRKIVRPSSCQSRSCPRSTSFSPHSHSKTTRPEGSRERPNPEGCSDPKELSTFVPFIFFDHARIPARERNLNLVLLEVA
jgi:hypothetical protein